MIRKVEIYQGEFDKIPNEEDLLNCIEIAKKDNCIVQLKWTMKWSGHYFIQIEKESDLTDLKNKINQSYPV